MKNKRICIFVIVCFLGILIPGINRENVYGEEKEYLIKVNMAMNCITVYEMGNTNEYTIPVKAFACSNFEDTSDEEKTYSIISKSDWKQMNDGTYSHYVINISTDISICSSPYTEQSNDTLDTEKFNGIGESKSTQNIWLCSSDAKWLYENCKSGINVVIYYDTSSPGPMGKPNTIKLNSTTKNTNWDPTDDSEDNPWKNNSARIEGVKNLDVNMGDDVDLLKNIKGYDICGNDISENIIVMGNYDFQKVGMYSISYYLKDATGSQANQSATINVREQKELVTSASEKDSSKVATPAELNNEKSNMDKIKVLIGIGIAALVVSFGIIKITKKD